MEHNFQIMFVNHPVTKDPEHIMFCVKCGLSYKYNGYTWEIIPIQPKPDGCDGTLNDED